MSLFNPNLIFTDESGIELTDLSFESIQRGKTTKIVTIVIKNNGDDCNNIVISPVVLDNSVNEMDSVGSTFISLNNINFSNEVRLSLDNGESHKLFLKWQPPYDAKPVTGILWGLRLFVDMNQINDFTC